LGLSQADLSRKSGLAQSVISQIESGKRKVLITTLLHICNQVGLEMRAMPWFMMPAIDEWDRHSRGQE
jgi:transcriptional regulator with XRE-family HTH domain